MSKRPETLEPVALAIELLRRIPRGRKISASELQAQITSPSLQRDIRTIQRQLEMLSKHFDIEQDSSSKPYGYRWKSSSKGLSLPILSEQESLLLMLAEQHLKSLIPASLMQSLDGFFIQARSNLTTPKSAKLAREWMSKVRVVSASQPLLAPAIKPSVFESVSNALYRNQWLKVEYKNAAGKTSAADVMPLGLAHQGPCLYLVCRYRGFDNERSLALHRMQSAEAMTLTFERPKEFNLQKYEEDGRFGFGEGKRIRLKFRISRDAGGHLLESPLSKDQKVREIDGLYEITATVVDSAVLDRWLLSFGDEVSMVRRLRSVVAKSMVKPELGDSSPLDFLSE